MNFQHYAILMGVALLGAAIAIWHFLPKREELCTKLPRERYLGIVIGFGCLFWSASLAYPLLEGGMAKFRSYLPFLVIALTVASFLYLEYLFTRALGAFLLLASRFLLTEAFVANLALPMRFTYSVVCYLMAILGMILIAYPWRFRDYLKRLNNEKKQRQICCTILLACSMISFTTLFF